MGILRTGFKLSAAGKSTGTMFGYGIYLAEAVSKSDEYSRDDNGGTFPGLMAILMCRSLVGAPYLVTDPGDYIEKAKSARSDCVLGDRESKVGTYREFIFFDERQVLPEYVAIYKRQYDPNKVPEHMRQATKGNTGRNWMVQLNKGWANIPPSTSFMLSQAKKKEETEIEQMINGTMFKFDLAGLTQTNLDTGTVRPIREPRFS